MNSPDVHEDADAATLRVAVVAPDSFQCQSLQQLVLSSTVLRLVASANTPAQLDPQASIDALLVDAGTPADEALIDAALATERPMVVLLRNPSMRVIAALNRAGASALPSSVSGNAITAALQCAAAGLIATTPAMSLSINTAALPEPLTARECEVLSLLAKGLPNHGIAKALSMSTHTAKFHVAQILAKLQATSRAQAVAIALREGLVATLEDNRD